MLRIARVVSSVGSSVRKWVFGSLHVEGIHHLSVTTIAVRLVQRTSRQSSTRPAAFIMAGFQGPVWPVRAQLRGAFRDGGVRFLPETHGQRPVVFRCHVSIPLVDSTKVFRNQAPPGTEMDGQGVWALKEAGTGAFAGH